MPFDFLIVDPKDADLMTADNLRDTCAGILRAVGVPAADAYIASDVLVLSDLRGNDSHGVANLKRVYVDRIRSGHTNPKPNIRVVHESIGGAALDGDGGMGLVVSYRAMEKAISKARQAGAAYVTAKNSRHAGMMGYFSLMAMKQGMIGFSLTSGSPHVFPFNGLERRLNTNPISFGAPGEAHDGFLLDMATTTVAANKVNVAARMGVPIPDGWALTMDGQPMTKPTEVGRGFAAQLLGGTKQETGGHKGYGLSMMVDIICGVLSGNGPGPVTPEGFYGQAFFAIDVNQVRPLPEFKGMLDEMVDAFHAVKPVNPEHHVQVAGEPEWEYEQERRANGIPLLKSVAQEIRDLAKEFGIECKI